MTTTNKRNQTNETKQMKHHHHQQHHHQQRQQQQKESGQTSYEALAADIDILLSKFKRVNESMGAAGGGGSTSQKHLLQRYHEILHDYTVEYRKLKGSIERKVESAALFRQVHGDPNGSGGGGTMRQVEYR